MMRTLGLAFVLALLAPAPAPAAPGDLDPAFNGGNLLLLDLSLAGSTGTAFNDARVDVAGRVVVAGFALDDSLQLAAALARLGPDGGLDPGFGDGGKTVVQAGRGGGLVFSMLHSLLPRPGGGWVTSGGASANDGRQAALVLAVDADGHPDLSYGSGGSTRAQLAGASPAATLAFGGGGGGTVDGNGGVLLTHAINPNPADQTDVRLVVARFTPAGDLASGFATTGIYTNTFSQTPMKTTTYGNAALLTPDDHVLFCGSTSDQNARTALVVGRLTSTGTLDTGFAGGAGYRVLQAADAAAPSPYSSAASLAQDGAGRIYVVGAASDADGHSALAVARLGESGVVDPTFGDGGVARVQTAMADPGDTPASFASGIALESEGRVLVVGSSGSGVYTEMVVVRLTSDGDPDPSFGTGGVVRFQPSTISEPETFGFGITVAPDGNSAIAVGQMRQPSGGRGVVARILLTSPTTTTTLPDPCGAAGSLPNVLCALDALSAAITANVAPGRLHDRFVGLVNKSRSAVQATDGQSGKPRRRSFKRAVVALKKLQAQLRSKRARSAIAGDARTAIASQTSQVAAALVALRDGA